MEIIESKIWDSYFVRQSICQLRRAPFLEFFQGGLLLNILCGVKILRHLRVIKMLSFNLKQGRSLESNYLAVRKHTARSTTRWLDKSGKPIQDHPELPKEPPEKTILKKTRGMPIGIMLKSKIVRETLKAKGYDLNQVETGEAQIDEDLMRLLEKLADDKPVIEGKGKGEPEVTILRRSETVGGENSLGESNPDGKEIVQSLVDKIPDDILERTRVRNNLSKWIRTGSKEKGDLEEDSYKILSQFYKERKDLLYHTVTSDRSVIQIARSNGAPGDRQGATENTSQV